MGFKVRKGRTGGNDQPTPAEPWRAQAGEEVGTELPAPPEPLPAKQGAGYKGGSRGDRQNAGGGQEDRGIGSHWALPIVGAVIALLIILAGALMLGYYLGRQSASLERIEYASGFRGALQRETPGEVQGGPGQRPGQEGQQESARRERIQSFLRAGDTELSKGKVKDVTGEAIVLETADGEDTYGVQDNLVVITSAGLGRFEDIKKEDNIVVFARAAEGEGKTAYAVLIVPSETQ